MRRHWDDVKPGYIVELLDLTNKCVGRKRIKAQAKRAAESEADEGASSKRARTT